MKLLSLHAHNVFSIGTIDLALRDRGLVLVTGWSEDEQNGNMAGKSSVANRAIVWGLYGKTVDGVKADLVINTSIKNAKHCGVTITFEGIDGKTYRIMRQRKPNELKLAAYSTYEVGSRVDEWVDLTSRNEKDTQELIDKLLGRDHKTFIQSDFFGQGRERSFLELPGSEQRAVIEEILPLTSLEQWSTNADAALKKAESAADKQNTNVKVQEARVAIAKSSLSTAIKQHNEWETTQQTLIEDTKSALKDIQQISSHIQDELDLLKQSLPSDVSIKEFLEENKNKLHALVVEDNTLSYRIDSLTSSINSRESKPDTCGACGQRLPSECINLNIVAIGADKLERDKFIKQRTANQAKRYNLEANIGVCNEALMLEERLAEKDKEIELNTRLDDLMATPNPYRHLVGSAKDELNKETRAMTAYVQLMKIATKDREAYRFWKNAFSKDIKTLLFDRVCPFLEERANQYLIDLQNGQIKVNFSTTKKLKSGDERDQFCVTASSDTGSEIFELFSGAEKQLTNFAVGMALSDLAAMQTQGSSSFMILDEPFLYQSAENCERILSFITHKLGHKSTILIISNEDNLINLVPNRIHVVKNKGVTSIG